MPELAIYSSEKVFYKYQLVGLGSRFVAFLLDYIIIMATYAVLAVFTFLTIPGMGFSENIVVYIYAGIFILAFFFILMYFVFFETVWNGQTPGKRLAGIRVIRATGEAVTLGNILVRNILRFIDFLPVSYTIGILTILFSKNRQRVGDMVAGTVVVKEKHMGAPETYAADNLDPVLADKLNPRIHLLSEQDFNIVTSYFARQTSLTPESSTRLAEDIARKLALKMEIEPEDMGEAVLFLQTAAALFKEKGIRGG